MCRTVEPPVSVGPHNNDDDDAQPLGWVVVGSCLVELALVTHKVTAEKYGEKRVWNKLHNKLSTGFDSFRRRLQTDFLMEKPHSLYTILWGLRSIACKAGASFAVPCHNACKEDWEHGKAHARSKAEKHSSLVTCNVSSLLLSFHWNIPMHAYIEYESFFQLCAISMHSISLSNLMLNAKIWWWWWGAHMWAFVCIYYFIALLSWIE